MAEPTLEDVMTAFEAFKAKNDERLAEIEAKGSADVITVEHVERINRQLDDFEDLNLKTTMETLNKNSATMDERLADIELALKRFNKTGIGGSDSPEIQERKDAFVAVLRFGSDSMQVTERQREVFGHIQAEARQIIRKEGGALSPEEARAMAVSDDTSGGYLAPPEYVREIIKDVTEISPVRSFCRVRSTGRESLKIPRRTGLAGAKWVAERGQRQETGGPTYGLESIPTHEMYAIADVSFQMSEDSEFNMESELNEAFTEDFALAEGRGVVTGDGSGLPEGYMYNKDVGETVSGSAATIADSEGQANGIIDLYHNVKTAYARNGVWTLNRLTLGSVRKLKDGQKQYIWQPGLAGLRPATILDQPYVETPDMPNEAADAYPIAFGDFRRAYTIVDRISMMIQRDPYTQQTEGNVRYHARRRVGGQVVQPEAIRKLKCAAS